MARPKKSTPSELTHAEMDVMQILWELKEATVGQVIEQIKEPKPAYNTTSTIIRILVEKKFVGFTPSGKSYNYYPLISRESYAERAAGTVLNSFFDNSLSNMVSFFTERENLSQSEIKKIIDLLESKRTK